jgi:hypothetical protein
MSEIDTIDATVKQVAELLPFPVELDADMGGTFTLQIHLGRRGGLDDPPDTAGIDPDDPNARWWVDIEGGTRTHISDLGLDADPRDVATWIGETARTENSPAAAPIASTGRVAALVSASYPTGAEAALAPQPGRPGSPREAPRPRESRHER